MIIQVTYLVPRDRVLFRAFTHPPLVREKQSIFSIFSTSLADKMYWFPSMERHEIIEAFNEWTIPVSLRDLEHPTSEFVTMIYSACLQRVRSLSETDLEKPLQAALAQVENPVRVFSTCSSQRASLNNRHAGSIFRSLGSHRTLLPSVSGFNC